METLGDLWPDADRRDEALIRLLARTEAGRIRRNGERNERYMLAPRARELLTPRECQVLEGMSRGLGRRGTAELLGVAEETVAAHLKRARYLLRSKNTTQAVAEAVRRGLIP